MFFHLLKKKYSEPQSGGITAFDGDYYLWTQSAPSNGGSQLDATPLRARALERASSSSGVAPAKLPFDPIAAGYSLLFDIFCVGDCANARASLQASVRSQLGDPCTDNFALNTVVNIFINFFMPTIGNVVRVDFVFYFLIV